MRFLDFSLWWHSPIGRLAVVLLLAVGEAAGQQVSSTLRADRVPLNGTWKFQMRHDNQLTSSGVVKFGPLTASSQVLIKEPARGENPYVRYNVGMPWGLAATLVGPSIAPDPAQAIWKPHPQQPGPSWWQADLGSNQTLASARVHWVKSGEVVISVEISEEGLRWRAWTTGKSKPDDLETTLSGPPTPARFVKLTFAPAQFEGTRKIEIRFQDGLGRIALWQPPVKKTWYEELRKYPPADGFHLPSFDDSAWSSIQVPGYWEAQGHGQATWLQPNDEVGYYRRAFTLPDAWRGRCVRLRFEGANHGAQVWLNGHEVGYHEGGFTAFEYDATPLLRFSAQNLIAVRISKLTLTSEYETDDAFYLGGLWRDVYLYSLPADHIEDFWVKTEFDPVYQNAVLKVELKLRAGDPESGRECIVDGSLFDAKGRQVLLQGFRTQLMLAGQEPIPAVLASVVKSPRKWTAETPYLYSLTLRLTVENKIVQEIKSTVGFRKVEVKGMRLLVNGVPVEIRGVVTTRANPNDSRESGEKVFAREIRLLKEGNINAIRSHTTPLEEEFLTLCDRYGIYVMPDIPYVWVLEDDFRYLTDDLVQRAREVFEYHKNHPSVILWHVGNENAPTTAYLGGGQASRWLNEHDPTRPVAVCRNLADYDELGTQISDLHYDPMSYPEFRELYPTPVLFGEFHAVPNEIARLKDRGFVETWGRSLEREWGAFRDRSPYVVGGFICCWDDGSLNGDLGFNQWGVLDSKRQAKPVHYHIRNAFSPIQLVLQDASFSGGQLSATLKVTNRYNFTDLTGFSFRWEVLKDRGRVSSGEEAFRVAPGRSFFFPLSLPAPGGADRLRISIHDSAGYSTQDEEFLLPAPSAPATVSDLLKKIGLAESPAVILDSAVSEIQTGSYRAQWGPEAQIRIDERAGENLVTLNGFAVQAEETAWSNLQSGSVQYQPARKRADALSIPFTIRGGTKDKKQSWQLPATLQLEFGEAWIRVSYSLEPDRELSLPEAGIRLLLARQLSRLSWNRDPLWSVAPEAWTDSSLEKHVSLQALRESISKRNVHWASLEGAGTALLLIPLGKSANLRVGSTPDEIVLSDFLSAGNFLGKFDKGTAEMKLAAGEKFQGGFVIYFLNEEQKRRFEALSDSERDLTWTSRTKLQVTN